MTGNRDRRAPDRDAPPYLSSVLKRVLAGGLLVGSVAAMAALGPAQRSWYAAQMGVPGAVAPATAPQTDPVAEGLVRWKRLQQSDSWPFADYAGFLMQWPGWPGESAMRRAAERRLDGVAAPDIVRFLDRFPPLTTTGQARFAAALADVGRTAEAQEAARAAWLGGALPNDEEARLNARFRAYFTQADQDRRMERLLWDRATGSAAGQMAVVSAARRPVFETRLALQTRRADAAEKADALIAAGMADAGLVVDRALWLRDNARSPEARAWLARPWRFTSAPFNAEKWLETLLAFARAAAADNQSTLAYEIARNADAAFPAGTVIRDRSLGERDDYTSVVWLGGTTALDRLNRPMDAMRMFERYAAAAQTPQTQTKGWYWAGRAALAARDATIADAWFVQAAAHPDQFYGQLAAERLGRPLAVPAVSPLQPSATERASFNQRSQIRAARILGEIGAWREQTQFLRLIAQGAASDADHVLIADLARDLRRPDLGVMVARAARNNGTADFVPTGFPQIAVPAPQMNDWVMIHAIARQESQFDREAISHAGARGLMQLMPAPRASRRERSASLMTWPG
jgi:soluble lytic murein transglycosylase